MIKFKDILIEGFKKGAYVSFVNDMTGKQEFGYILKKMGNKYLIGDTPNVDTRKGYFRDAFDTPQGKMKLAKEGKLNEYAPSIKDVKKAIQIIFPDGTYFRRHPIKGGKWFAKGIANKLDDKTMAQFIDDAGGNRPIYEGKLNEFEGKPMPMDTPNEFAYLDFKKFAYKHRSQYKKDMLKHNGDSSKMFMTASSWWFKWAYKKAKAYTHIKDKLKFGRALIVMMVDDNLIFDKVKWKKDNRITHVKEDSTKLSEIITIPIEIGDVVMGGKFKNKKITVKEIGTNEKGDITINGKSILRVRVIPEDGK